MKKILTLIVLILLFNSCEKPSDCIESSGATVLKDVEVLPFKKIKVYRGIEVVITQGPETKVQIEAGANFIDNVEVKQYGDQLVFKDETSCNWVRAYGKTKILITTPTLEEIYSKTDRNISSNGVLGFDNLTLFSFDKDADGESGAGTGDFIMTLNSTGTLTINNNNVSRFYLSGQMGTANFNFYFGDGRIEAANLITQDITVYHRGSNDMIVHPVQSITGLLNSTGNLVLKNVPPIVDLQTLFYGSVVYP
ncbi:head GIN domain-containing protein [Flavobacterium phycosphaerae]|uniref:head GIN domain-containing protein n=1 Tax=Flavobacterium phycosphaerae TaxID=2697515 RepID=UPI001389FF85|nr:head GIN domain-containing protein [Flavobacterium phycosphaerae]